MIIRRCSSAVQLASCGKIEYNKLKLDVYQESPIRDISVENG